MRLVSSFLFSIFCFLFFQTASAQTVKSLMYAHDSDFGILNTVSTPPTLTNTTHTGVPTNLEGIAHVNDPLGNLLFYATGDGVFKADGTLFPGSGAMSSNAGITEINITSIPGVPQRYLVFYTDQEGCGLLYSTTVDVAFGNAFNVNTLLSDTNNTNGLYAEGKEIVEKPNSSKKYLLVRRCDFGFETFEITQAGVGDRLPVRSWTPSSSTPGHEGRGELDYHNERVAYASRESDQIISFEFNPCGRSSNGPLFTYNFNGAYGVEFSQTANRLYGSSEIPDSNNIISIQSGTSISEFYQVVGVSSCNGSSVDTVGLGQLELLGNNKIYCPVINECAIVEFEFLESTAAFSHNILPTTDKQKPGLSDLVQSEVYLDFVQYSFNITPVSCIGESDGSVSIQLEGGMPPYDITWFDGSKNYSKSGLATGNYTVTIRDASCGNQPINANVYVPEPDSLKIKLDIEHSECFGEPGKFGKIITGGTQPYNVTYSPSFDEMNPLAGFYTIFVEDHRGCQTQDTFRIKQPDQITWELEIQDPLCFGDPAIVTVKNLQGGVGDLYVNQGLDTIIELNQGHEHTVIFSDYNGCVRSEKVKIDEVPELKFDSLVVIQDDCDDFVARVEAYATGGTGEYKIEYEGFDPNRFYQGNYSVKVTDENDCVAYGFFNFKAEETKVIVPNVFTPNGDGRSEFFIPSFRCERDFSYKIYSRWGELMYETSPDEKRWFGFDQKEKKVESGMYIYVIDYTDSRGKTHQLRGTVMVTY
jgi:gliding motility-associated-like protein